MLGFAGLLVFVAVLFFPILATVAFLRTREIGALRSRIEALESALSRVQSAFRAMKDERPPPTMDRTAPEPRTLAPAVVHTPPAPPTPPSTPIEKPVPVAPPPAPPARPPTPVARPAAPPPPTPAPPPALQIDWERWIGIRGAAVLGGVVLALAALLFFQYSIQHGLITPLMRVVLGIAVGTGCLVGSELLRPRGYSTTAEGIAGAGIVCLYAAFWAAHTLYGLVGIGFTFVLMALVTVVCCVLASRHASQVVAVLGLVGGFATPLLLRSQADRPVGLFGYVLLLDLGLLAIGKKKGWPLLGVLSLAGTVLLQGLWVGARMTPERLFLGLAILAVFAAFFAVGGQLGASTSRREWLVSQAGAILFPFAFALHFASRVELGPHLWPLAILLALLAGAAGWIGRANDTPWLGTGAAWGTVAVVAVWMLRHSLTTSLAWELVFVAFALALVFHVFVELDPEPAWAEGPALAAIVAACGLFVVTLAAVRNEVPPWPWIPGWLALGALLYRHAAFQRRAPLQLFAAIGTGVGLTFVHARHVQAAGVPDAWTFLGVLVGLSALAQVVAVLRRKDDVRRFAQHAAAALPVVLIIGFPGSPFLRTVSLGLFLGAILVLGILALHAATRLCSGPWYAAAAAATAIVHGAVLGRTGILYDPAASSLTLGYLAGTVLLFNGWPFAAGGRLARSHSTLYTAALAGPVWFWPMKLLFVARFGDRAIGVLPIALGVVSLAAAAAARRVWLPTDPARRRSFVWFSAVAISFVSVAIPLQLEKEWITVGWALEGLALIALWRRLDDPGLMGFGLAALAASTARLVANPALLHYYPRTGVPIFNWILYTYLVPAAALLGSATMLAPLEVERVREAERPFYAHGKPTGAVLAGLAAIAVVFVWINLAIADWFTEGPALTLRFGRSPARDLTVSIAWAIYALALLLLGMFREKSGLRWLSLAFLVVTIGKVFLYDLGELRDLYRVASLVGLAASLILVSLLYQRFVFRKRDSAIKDGAP